MGVRMHRHAAHQQAPQLALKMAVGWEGKVMVGACRKGMPTVAAAAPAPAPALLMELITVAAIEAHSSTMCKVVRVVEVKAGSLREVRMPKSQPQSQPPLATKGTAQNQLKQSTYEGECHSPLVMVVKHAAAHMQLEACLLGGCWHWMGCRTQVGGTLNARYWAGFMYFFIIYECGDCSCQGS